MRDVPQGKAPSVTMIDIKPKGKPPMPGPGAQAGPDDEGAEFTCPSCGASLKVSEDSGESAEPSDDAAMGGMGR